MDVIGRGVGIPDSSVAISFGEDATEEREMGVENVRAVIVCSAGTPNARQIGIHWDPLHFC